MLYSTLLLALSASVMAAPANVKRDGWSAHCLGAPLDHAGTDSTHDQLVSWAGPVPVIKSGNHNQYVSFDNNGVMGYACTDDHDGSNYFSSADIVAAYAAMDAACPPYTSSWAIWQETGWWLPSGAQNTGKIIGKDVSGAAVCQGYNGH